MKRKCIKVISGNEFVIDKPIYGLYVVELAGVKKKGKAQETKLRKMIEGKQVDVFPTGKSYGKIR